jgi:hypothetical protein
MMSCPIGLATVGAGYSEVMSELRPGPVVAPGTFRSAASGFDRFEALKLATPTRITAAASSTKAAMRFMYLKLRD